jgi:diguanylate cyclase (GGDEF)-like protein
VGRLSLSFIAVAVLAVAANFMVDHSDVIQTTRIRTIVTPAAPAAPMPRHTQPAASLKVAPAIDYSRTLELFAQAELERVASDTEDTRELVKSSAVAFGSAAAAMAAQIQSADPKLANQMLEASSAVNAVAEALVHTADGRRSALSEYRRHLDLLASSVHSALDSSFKIFGRVVTRQNLLQLADDLTAFRQRLDLLVDAEATDASLKDIAHLEQRFKVTLDEYDSNLTRVYGRSWIDSIQQELAALSAQRAILERLGAPFRSQREALTQEKIAAIAVMERGLAAMHASQMNSAAGMAIANVPVAAASEHELAPVETITVTPRDRSTDELVAWITVGVIGSVFLISLITVGSIVRPVRRLLDAADRISRGDTRARVQRGGLRELDELAGSFNRMAEDLAKANEISRFYQARLESDVAARTLELKDLAERDPLTQLPNRRHWLTLMSDSLAAAKTDVRQVGVFFIDLDNFKTINDSLGHAFGDKVLQLIASRLLLVSGKFGHAARLGGDEFSVIYANAKSSEEIHRAGERLVQAFRAPMQIEQRELMVSVSAGLSVFPSHGANPDELLSAADAALFRAKSMGRNRLNVFTPDLLRAANEKFTIEQRLRRAIERNELELVYQPEVCASSFKVGLVEALLRWRQPDGRMATPSEFLAVAETSGFIADIDAWVMRSAIEAAAAWHHGGWPEARVAINVSPRQLMDSGFAEHLHGLLAARRLPARCVEIELTETVLQTGAPTIQTLHRLKEFGITTALDDFGTGFSSLTSLEQLPLSRVKLDRSIIAGLGANDRSAAIARAIITLCEHLQLEVTAEGVETEQQLAWLLKHRSLSLQGYLITRPLDRQDVLPSLTRLQRQMAAAVTTLSGISSQSMPPALFIAGNRK